MRDLPLSAVVDRNVACRRLGAGQGPDERHIDAVVGQFRADDISRGVFSDPCDQPRLAAQALHRHGCRGGRAATDFVVPACVDLASAAGERRNPHDAVQAAHADAGDAGGPV
ncbi:hypothetical protein D3C86_1779480 [compost metagenome]